MASPRANGSRAQNQSSSAATRLAMPAARIQNASAFSPAKYQRTICSKSMA
jgi:hypothetical protein